MSHPIEAARQFIRLDYERFKNDLQERFGGTFREKSLQVSVDFAHELRKNELDSPERVLKAAIGRLYDQIIIAIDGIRKEFPNDIVMVRRIKSIEDGACVVMHIDLLMVDIREKRREILNMAIQKMVENLLKD